MARLLTIMGSGETAPTMVKAHREVFTRLGVEAPNAVVLDTPYGFQTNADIVSDKAVAYFRESVGRPVSVAGLRRTDTAERVELERALALVTAADWLFTGPGSPSFALRQWRGTPVPDVLARKLTEQGALVFSSAAALTLGILTVPVYEVYKVGADPYWLDGLDLLSRFGLPVAVIPHFDNTEGGNHDTRFCYLGLERLERMEQELPSDAFVLGVDEHTALVIDLEADAATIVGRGGVTLRRGDRHRVLAAGQTVPLDVLRAGADDVTVTAAAVTPSPPAPREDDTQETASVAEVARRAATAFDEAVGAGDADRALAAVLELDDAIAAWSADTFQSDEMDRARATLRAMIVRLAEAARRRATRSPTGGRPARRGDAGLADEGQGRRPLRPVGPGARRTGGGRGGGPRHRPGRRVGAQSGFVRAPVSAPCTRRAYLASTPDV